jgi:hypothetical protein
LTFCSGVTSSPTIWMSGRFAFSIARACYWHFRFDANSDIKMEALTNFIRTRPEIKKIYLINQD